jgi:acyl-CoA thioesterase FadM
VLIQAWYSRIGTTSLTTRYEFYRASDRVHRASGSLTVVSVDKETMRPKPIPDDVKELLSRFAATA